MKGIHSPVTWDIVSRRYVRMSRDINSHYAQKKISTTSPMTMTVEDIRYHLTYIRSLNHSKSEYQKEVSAFISLFDYCSNMSVRTCLIKYRLLNPSRNSERLPSMPPEDYHFFIQKMNEINKTDYRRVRAYALVSIMLGCGSRTKEIQFTKVSDVDLDLQVYNIVHVKGEASWGSSRVVPIPPEIVPILKTYLLLRSKKHYTSNYLFTSNNNSVGGYLSGNTLRKIAQIVKDDTGLEFNFQKCRRTFGQNYLDADLQVESLSVLMGHASTKTTESYYARRRNVKAISDAKKTWNSSNPPNDGVSKNNEPDSKRSAEDGRHFFLSP